ncbi:MAG: CRTAC1 family protein [Gammaproteobacteria bacterium]|nr:CRTAC1 family protein [Gammaproteobacteria bacterium]
MRISTTVFVLWTIITLSIESANAEIFRDVTDSSDLDFAHQNGEHGVLWLAEILGSGVGVLDVDDDGLLDIWAIQGGPLLKRQGALPSDQIFKNVTREEGLRFRPITAQASVNATRYGMGIATGDVDRDGDVDVFLANFGQNELWINRGNGSFDERSVAHGLVGEEWSITGSFVDVNRDGLLDLYVVNYVGFTTATHKECLGISLRPDYCAPSAYAPTPDQLYLNIGDGIFQDESKSSNIDSNAGGGLGVISADFDADGLIDLYVANDPTANFLWRNLGLGRFIDIALVTGSAVNGDGKSEASMGIDARDFDHDCDTDLFMTNLTAETNTLFRNSGKGWFIDATNQAKLGASSYPYTGFGTGWVDIDLDGDLDLFAANGAVSFLANEDRSSEEFPLGQRNQLWVNTGQGQFVEVLDDEIVVAEETSRGVAFADLDNDGDPDILVANNSGPLRVFENVTSSTNNWIGLTVKDQHSYAYHAKINIVGESCVSRVVRTDGSYASANDPRVVFGLGKTTSKPRINIAWSDGETQTFGPLAINQYHVLER